MPFPPNYSQERKNREAAKQRKAREKQQKREENSTEYKHDNAPGTVTADPPKEDI